MLGLKDLKKPEEVVVTTLDSGLKTGRLLGGLEGVGDVPLGLLGVRNAHLVNVGVAFSNLGLLKNIYGV